MFDAVRRQERARQRQGLIRGKNNLGSVCLMAWEGARKEDSSVKERRQGD
jgi:hypothetical protein